MTRRSASDWLSDLWSLLSVYLPVIVMALLALGSWWLVRNAPQLADAAVVRAPSQEPDWTMHDFQISHFDAQGRLTQQVAGSEARHFPDRQQLEVREPRIRAVDTQGRTSTARAARAWVNDDSSQVELLGQAQVMRPADAARGEPALRIAGEQLIVRPGDGQVQTEQPVLLEHGASQMRGDQMRYDNQSGVLDLRGRVRGVLPPRPQP